MDSLSTVYSKFIEKNFLDLSIEDPSSFKTRAKLACLLPVEIAIETLNGFVTIPLVFCNVITAGKFKEFNQTTNEFAMSTRESVSSIYAMIIRVLNPGARRDNIQMSDGIIPGLTTRELRYFARDLRRSDNLLVKEVATRIVYLVSLAIAPLARTADAAISIIAVPVSLITLGKFSKINTIAAASLRFPGILFDINYFGSHLILPNQFE